ncbi:MAG: polysaccharide deacetylase family protein [Acidimicrobiia bacterium]|nr:polysaccharide deacetylase family protein [Acidimicrobiia bacterium]
MRPSRSWRPPRPHRPRIPDHARYFRVETPDRIVALTFDDGPDPRWTPTVLAMLAHFGAHATFFDIGESAARVPGLVLAELHAGNEVADHTWSHAHLLTVSDRALAAEIAADRDLLGAIAGRTPAWFRPPYDEWDAEVARAAVVAGMHTVLWSACVERFIDHRSIAGGVSELLEDVRPGAIILAHDGGVPGRQRTMTALPLLLAGLARSGYRITTVSELLRQAGRAAHGS